MTNTNAVSILSTTIARRVQQTLRDRHTYVETLAEQTVRDGTAAGYVDIEGQGESIVAITFPILFLEKPVFTTGLELAPNTALKWESFPVWSAVVASWDTETAYGDPLYAGATVGIAAFGITRAVLHYQFQGRSYTTPVAASANVGATL